MGKQSIADEMLAPVPFTSVVVTDDFWSPKQSTMARDGLPLQLLHLKANHHVDNFRVVAGLQGGTYRTMFYYDSDLYKWVEAASIACHVLRDDALEREVDLIVDAIIKAQQPDGYVNTFFCTTAPQERMKWPYSMHEMYSGGHLIEAGVSRAMVTGKEDLLHAGIKFADFLISWREQHPKSRMIPGHQEIELALYRLWRKTGEQRFRDLARDLLRARGTDKHVGWTAITNGRALLRLMEDNRRRAMENEETTIKEPSKAWPNVPVPLSTMIRFAWSAITGRYTQQHAPVLAQREPTGHAVRATYMYSAMADWYMESGERGILDVLDSTWNRMVQRRMHVTGGLGPLPLIEGWGRDFELNDEKAYCETCAAIGNVLWNWRMFLATGQSKYVDVMELALYNGVLGGWSLDGKGYTYVNPLAGKEVRREEWFECACCPPNVGRVVMGIGGLIAATGKDGGITIALHAGARIQAGNGRKRETLMTRSSLPWDGKFEVDLPEEVPPSLSIRVPAWATGFKIAVNGQPVDFKPSNGTIKIPRDSLLPGGHVTIEFPFTGQFVHPHKGDKGHRGQVAVKRGPLVYCAEAIDNNGMDPRTLAIDVAAPLAEKVMVVQGHRVVGLDAGGVVLVPFFARGNRESGAFATWFKVKGAMH